MTVPAAFGINSGVTAPIGLPQITVSGAFTFGGIGGFPQGRGDNTEVLSDTVSWVHGKHTIKFGAEFRRANSDNFSFTPGTFTFPSINAFIADQATGFTVTNTNRSNRTYGNSLGAFAMDTWKMAPTLTVTLGLRYDWYGTPTEAGGRFVVFNPTADALQHISDAVPTERAQLPTARRHRLGSVQERQDRGPHGVLDHDRSADARVW